MKNNLGFGKFEVITVIVVLLLIFAYLMRSILGFGKSDSQKISEFKEAAYQFNKAVYTNIDSFRNERVVYLDEVLEQGLMANMKSPFGSKTCDLSESKVESPDPSSRYVTLKCDDYLIDHELSSDLSQLRVYKVGKWQENKIEGENVQSKELYNCLENGKGVLDNYLEEDYFVVQFNKLYSQNNFGLASISEQYCKIDKKTFYRTKEVVEEK